MHPMSLDTFNQLLAQSHIKPRLKRELRFVTSTAPISDDDWYDRDFLVVSDRSGNKGALLIPEGTSFYLLGFELKRGLSSKLTGRAQAVICDLCKTWQSGSRAGSITFLIPKTKRTVTYLCCADLRCSDHVRTKTSAAHTSRAQLRENISTEERVERLRKRLTRLLKDLEAEAILPG